MPTKFNVIVAVCENMGIGKNGDLPWRLKSEMAYFSRITSTSKLEGRRNAVLMGRKTWDSIPDKFKPLPNRLNIIVSRNLKETNFKDAVVAPSFEDALSLVNKEPLKDGISDVWVIGGSQIYKEAVENPHCHKIYLTKVMKNFDCDVFFPSLNSSFVETKDEDVPVGVQEEKGIKYEVKVYENLNVIKTD